MGLSPFDVPSARVPDRAPWLPEEIPPLPRPVALRPREPRLRYVVLFVLTALSTTAAGVWHAASFATGLRDVEVDLYDPALILQALWYSGGVIAILGAHEFGHYFACRYYGVRASLPYFIPFWLPIAAPGAPWWLPWPTPGTFGAVIRIRQLIPSKRQFFDIGIAGPIAGFLVLIPVLVFAMVASELVRIPGDFQGIEFGEPLLFRLVAWMVFGEIPPNYSVNLHPAGWAAWFGMLATALNLAPVGQLDGGHISYAVFGRRSSIITMATVALLIGLLAISFGYLLWTVIVVLMVLALGPHHPRTMDEAEPLDSTRLALAAFALVMFILCFTPVPVELIGM
jgi:membrane-associated protease RseP (regulator of RpoE activity)